MEAKDAKNRQKVRPVYDMVKNISAATGVPRAHVLQAIRGMRDEMLDVLKAGEIFRLLDVGNTRLLPTAPRKARNPRTGETIDVGARFRVKFNAGTGIDQLVNHLLGDGEAPTRITSAKAPPKSDEKPSKAAPKAKAAPAKAAKPAAKPAKTAKPAKPAKVAVPADDDDDQLSALLDEE